MTEKSVSCLSLADIRKFVDLVKKTRSLQKAFYRSKRFDANRVQLLRDSKECELDLDFEVQQMYRKIENAVNENQNVFLF